MTTITTKFTAATNKPIRHTWAGGVETLTTVIQEIDGYELVDDAAIRVVTEVSGETLIHSCNPSTYRVVRLDGDWFDKSSTERHSEYVANVLASLNNPTDPTQPTPPVKDDEPSRADRAEAPAAAVEASAEKAEALLAAASYRVAVSSHSGISNASVLPAIQAIPAAMGAALTVAQDWYLETLRRCAGELTDAREGVGYLALCQSLCPSNQVGWLRANGYSDDAGSAVQQFVDELADLTPHLQNAVDWLIANGARFEEQVAA